MQPAGTMQARPLIDVPSQSNVIERRPRFAINASVAVAALIAMMSLGGLLLPSAYAGEMENWEAQAIAQDWFDLVIAAPALLLAALWASRGSRRGRLVLGGLLLFAVYTLLIYAFAVHLNVLFLVYCSGLGLSVYGLISLARATEPAGVITWFSARTPCRAAGSFLIALGIAFGLLWLLQLVPAAITGREPAELEATGLLTNPIHVIDLSFILPLQILAGVLLWKQRPLGYVLAPVVLVFDVVMAASIGFLMVMMELRGVSSGGIPVAIAMTLVAMAALVMTSWTLNCIRSDEPAGDARTRSMAPRLNASFS